MVSLIKYSTKRPTDAKALKVAETDKSVTTVISITRLLL